MVTKRDFDKILVNLLRSNPNLMNIALIDAEGIPISFAIKSRKYQIKPATLGSKTKVLLYLSKNLAKIINITNPVIQVYFFEEFVLLIINLKVVNFFLLIDIKGWPADGKLLYENFVKVKQLLAEVEKSKDDSLKGLFASEKQDEFKISDLSDTFLKIIAKNINSLNQISIKPIKVNVAATHLKKDDKATFSHYFKHRLNNPKILESIVFTNDDDEIYKSEKTTAGLRKSVKDFISTATSELEIFNLGEPIWFLNIFEKSELLIMNKLGTLGGKKLYSGLVMENRVGNLTKIGNLLYIIASEINGLQSNPILKSLIQSLELVGFSVKDLNVKINNAQSMNQLELAEIYLERAINKLIGENKFSDAGDFYYHMADIYAKSKEYEKAEQALMKASDLHLKQNNNEKVGDVQLRIGVLAKMAGDTTKAFEHFNKAITQYRKSGSADKMKKADVEISKIKSNIKNQIKNYLSTSTGESIPFSFLQEKFKLSENGLVEIFKLLFDGNEIPGQINLIKKRYTKKKFGSKESIVGESTISSETYTLPEIKRSTLVQKQRKLESQLGQYESFFESINFPFDKYLEYQTILMENDFLETKMNIYNKSLDKNTCILCFKKFTKESEISDCGNDHYYHLNCLKLWLENQTKCPICDTNILDNLKVYYLDTIQAKDDLLSLQDIVKTLKLKINNLEQELTKKEEQIYLMKEYSEKDKSIFEKLMVERDSKHMLEKEIKKNNQIIQELRSLLEIIKR